MDGTGIGRTNDAIKIIPRVAQRRSNPGKVFRTNFRLIAKLVPNSGIKPNVSQMPFKQMENINNFLVALDKMGVPKYDQFQTIDLFEAKNMVQVVDTIFAFSRNAVKKGYTDILLGPKLADKHEVEFSQETLNKGKTIISLQMGTNTGANASGINYGARRECTPKK